MKRNLIKTILVFFALAAVLYPIWVCCKDVQWSSLTLKEFLGSIFPPIGLTAFSIMWLHIVGTPFKVWLNKYLNFDNFVKWSAVIVLLFIILHPLLLFLTLGFSNLGILFSNPASKYIWFGIIGWFMLITYDVGKAFKNSKFFIKYWNIIDIISTLGFFVIFFHSIKLGDDLRSGPLKLVWYFYAITAGLATIYKFIIQKHHESA